MSLLAELKAGARNCKVVKYPGTERDVAVRILTNQEILDAKIATEKLFRGHGIEYGPAVLDAYEEEKQAQFLFRALRDPQDQKAPFAKSIEELRALTTQDERAALADEYLAYQDEVSPDPAEMSVEDLDALVEDVKKSPALVSSVSSIRLLRRLTMSLAGRLVTLQTGSGSTSS